MSISIILIAILIVIILAFIIIVGIKLGQNESAVKEIKFPYLKKKYFFSQSEQELFRILTESLDASRYAIFPKVRLGDFIEVDLPKGERMPYWNRIKSRHVDFLIWDIEQRTILAGIELDGISHNGTKAIEADDFKNKLYETVGIKLVRIRVGTNFTDEVKTLISQL